MAGSRNLLWGPLSLFGLGVAALTIVADQLHKAWMLYVFNIGEKTPVAIAPFFDLVLVWNQGISYGLLPQQGELGRIGLIIGGAIGNAIDRIAYGAVADFFSFHAFGFEWYVFNIADTAIVAGVL